MINKLRKKFIIISMLSVTLVLAVLIAAINIFNYREVIRNADEVLDMLIENNGEMPDTEPEPFGKQFGNQGDGKGKRRGQMSPEMKYETRFF